MTGAVATIGRMATTTRRGAPLIFPIGHYLGAHYPSVGAELDFHLLRIGWETYKLSGNEQLGVWALAHGLPEGHEMAPWTRPAVEGAARATGIPGAAHILEELIGKDLVIEASPGTAEAVEFARVCRIRSLLLGLGNTSEEPLLYGIGLAATKPVVKVPSFTYELWKWGHACDSLWHAVQIFAQAGRNTAPGDSDQTDPERILTRCLAATQVLVAHGAAYLDEAREEWDQEEGEDPLAARVGPGAERFEPNPFRSEP